MKLDALDANSHHSAMEEIKQELEKALVKREELLLCGSNDEVLNDRIKELRNLIENAD